MKNKISKKSNFIFITIVTFIFVICLFVGDFYLKEMNGESKYLMLNLIGDREIIVKFKDEYSDPGAKSSYKSEDLTSQIKVDTDIDFNHIGTYSYTYSVKYKKQNKEIKRIVKIVDEDKPSIKLKGDSTMTIVIGSNYNEPGATAIDNYDGDLSDKIEIDTKNLNTEKIGTYKVIYSVKDSSGNDNKIERTVNVTKKPPANQKIAVLNYHFFYENWDENCHEDICLKMDKFREQLKYLKDNGYYTLSMDEFVKWMYGEIEVPEKSVLITIDDGAHGTSKINGNHLIPALEEYQVHATLFLITGWWDIENYRSEYLDIQSHTNNLHYEQRSCGHRSKVNCVSYDTLLDDLKKSISITKDSKSFCFPFYEYSDTSLKAVKDAGFKVAFIGGWRKASRSDNKYLIPRYPIYDSTSMNTFINMIS